MMGNTLLFSVPVLQITWTERITRKVNRKCHLIGQLVFWLSPPPHLFFSHKKQLKQVHLFSKVFCFPWSETIAWSVCFIRSQERDNDAITVQHFCVVPCYRMTVSPVVFVQLSGCWRWKRKCRILSECKKFLPALFMPTMHNAHLQISLSPFLFLTFFSKRLEIASSRRSRIYFGFPACLPGTPPVPRFST